MEKDNKKPGFFKKLAGIDKEKKGSCCCNFELEEVPEENAGTENPEPGKKKTSCCG